MRTDHLRGWLATTTSEEDLETEKWYQVIELVKKASREGRLLAECTWKMVVLIPKGNGYSRGIGLVEVLWKTVSGVINRHIRVEVHFHHLLHDFWEGRGARTVSLEENLLQNLAEMREEMLYEGFLYL